MGAATTLKFSNVCLLDPDHMKSYLSPSHICLYIFIYTNFSSWFDLFKILKRQSFLKEIWKLNNQAPNTSFIFVFFFFGQTKQMKDQLENLGIY